MGNFLANINIRNTFNAITSHSPDRNRVSMGFYALKNSDLSATFRVKSKKKYLKDFSS